MTFMGIIVEESLKDNRFLNQLEIVGIRISSAESPEDRWHLFKVNIAEEDIQNLSQQLKSENWYMHFWNGDDIIAVFPNKMFQFKRSDKSTWRNAAEYGRSLGIPDEQLDFVVE